MLVRHSFTRCILKTLWYVICKEVMLLIWNNLFVLFGFILFQLVVMLFGNWKEDWNRGLISRKTLYLVQLLDPCNILLHLCLGSLVSCSVILSSYINKVSIHPSLFSFSEASQQEQAITSVWQTLWLYLWELQLNQESNNF